MKKTYKMMLAVAILFAAVLQVAAQAVVVPPTDGTYFYIQFTRGTNLVLQNEGSANRIKAASLVLGKDAQLWKAVSDGNGTGGFRLVSKAKDTDGTTELSIAWDATATRFILKSYIPANYLSLYTTTTGITTNAKYLPACAIVTDPASANGMNPSGGSVVGAEMASWGKADDGDALRFVPELAPAPFVQWYINQLTATAASAVASAQPGGFSTATISTFQSAISAEQGVASNVASTLAECNTSISNLKAALTTYNSSISKPVVSSADASAEKWYFLQGTRPPNSYLTSTGAGANVFSKTVIPDDTQLWKIVNNTNPAGTLNGYALVNKKTGEYLNADILTNNTILNTVAAMPVQNLVFNLSDSYVNGIARFWIENAGTTSASTSGFTFRLHAGDGANNAKNWYGNRGDNSAWLIMDYSVALKVILNDAITAANVVVNDATIPEGTLLGQYPTDAKPTLTAAVATAQGVYNDVNATDAVIKAAITNLNTAVSVYKGRRCNAVVSSVESPRWFVIKNMFRTDAALVKNQVITANGGVENGGVICEAQANTNDQLWRFEASATGGVKIINAAKPTLAIQDAGYNVQQKLATVANASTYIIDILGTGYKLTSTVGNPLHQNGAQLLYTWTDGAGSATNWTIEERTLPLFVPQTITFAAIPAKTTSSAAFDLGVTTNSAVLTTYTSSNAAVATVSSTGTVVVVGQGTTEITASNAGDATYAKASVKQTLTVTIATGLQNVTDGINVLVKNRVIAITGTNAPVRAFAVTGAEVDAKKALTQGIYIVKVAGKTVKVNVQ